MVTPTGAGRHGEDGGGSTPPPPPCRARRSEYPSLATTSTARGRSATVEPSRKRPSDRHTSGSRHACVQWLVLQHAGDVGPGHQAGDGDVPAEEVVAHGDDTHVRQLVAEQRLEHGGAVLAGEDGDRRVAVVGDRRPARCGAFDQAWRALLGARGAVSRRRRAVDPREEPGLHAVGGGDVAVVRGFEGAGHADAVLVLGEAVIGLDGRERPAGEEVVLVRRVHEAPTDGLHAQLLPLLDEVDDGTGLIRGVGTHRGLGGVVAHPQGHARHGGEVAVLVQDARQCRLEGAGVVDPRAHHDLSVHLDPSVEQGPQPAQAGRAPGIAQHPGPELRVGAVDGHEQRREPLGQDALEVELGETGEGGEVPVEERQPVVVVLQVQAAPHSLGELVDEAELAVVVAGSDPVEERRGDFDPGDLPRPLAEPDGELLVSPPDGELGVGLVDEQAVLDHVAGHAAVDGEQLVVHPEAGTLRRGGGRHRDHPGRRHALEATRSPASPRLGDPGTQGR